MSACGANCDESIPTTDLNASDTCSRPPPKFKLAFASILTSGSLDSPMFPLFSWVAESMLTCILAKSVGTEEFMVNDVNSGLLFAGVDACEDESWPWPGAMLLKMLATNSGVGAPMGNDANGKLLLFVDPADRVFDPWPWCDLLFCKK